MRRHIWSAGLALLLTLLLCACANGKPNMWASPRAAQEKNAALDAPTEIPATSAPEVQDVSVPNTVAETGEALRPHESAQYDEPSTGMELTTAQTQLVVAEDEHFLVARQSKEIQTLFWTIYRGIQAFQDRIVLPQNATRAQVETVGELLSIDCPELFYFSHLSAVYYPEGRPDCINEVGVSYSMGRVRAGEAQTALDRAVQPLLDQTQGLSDYEKERFAHDRLIQGCTYDTSAPNAGTVYGALVEGRARCQGYANAMNYLLRRMGLPCAYLYGTAENAAGSTSHAWNLVCVNEVWTLVDATWDDPTGSEEMQSYAYFNLNAALMGESHVLDAAFERYALPSCTSLSESYSARQGVLIYEDGSEEAVRLLAAALAQGSPSLCLQFAEREDYRAVVEDVQGLLQRAAEKSGVFPGNVAYVTDEGAHWLEFRAIDYGE